MVYWGWRCNKCRSGCRGGYGGAAPPPPAPRPLQANAWSMGDGRVVFELASQTSGRPLRGISLSLISRDIACVRVVTAMCVVGLKGAANYVPPRDLVTKRHAPSPHPRPTRSPPPPSPASLPQARPGAFGHGQTVQWRVGRTSEAHGGRRRDAGRLHQHVDDREVRERLEPDRRRDHGDADRVAVWRAAHVRHYVHMDCASDPQREGPAPAPGLLLTPQHRWGARGYPPPKKIGPNFLPGLRPIKNCLWRLRCP